MAAVPITIQCLVYPRNKTVEPFPATIVGTMSLTGVGVGGGPIEPPPEEEKPPRPPLTIWPKPGDPDFPEHLPSPWPPDPPPVDPPVAVEPPHEGWNWSEIKSQWYYIYVPGEGAAQPKRR